ncbi:TRAP transporter substrate-binding protein [Oceanidesulfovibrio marinus]|uniref:ABC transporter substrate-binding protein n=1 Tax=Oceanidesulfovibrio marinus TaxID=370038 RepID=A0A6P1ZEA1_9BACT|nr:TRAP transporter substrate-binding protein [Oceanidesulfovibrio marinus]QJT07720.1 ABC transporter substrate-binding protein [Oceanidesulfovibrio marinus]TVM32077.1 ABC transporter substrate-binding protein [Oceanidesulfovibrio marinus]
MFKRFLLALAFVVLAAPAAVADTIAMDCNAIYPASNFHTIGAQNFAEKVKEYTDGSVDITVHPGGSLGFKGPELLKAVKDGTLPMSDILMGVVSGSDEIFGLTTMPLLVNSYEQAMQFYQTAKPYYEKACARWNQKLLYAAPWPRSGLYTKKPVEKLADIAGLKIRTYDKNGADFLQRAGASPQSLPWGEVYTALSTGLIDSVLTSATSGKDGKFWEVLDYFTKLNYSYPLNMLTINMDYWNALSPEQQEAMEKAAAEVEDAQWNASKKSVEDSIAALKENGMTINEMTPELAASLKKIAVEMRDEMKEDNGPDFKAVLDEFSEDVN